ncbi:hypothetical protein BDC45DRAFT_525038, partial [Circinella umbellata]
MVKIHTHTLTHIPLSLSSLSLTHTYTHTHTHTNTLILLSNNKKVILFILKPHRKRGIFFNKGGVEGVPDYFIFF